MNMNTTDKSHISPIISVVLIVLVSYLLYLSNGLSEIVRPYAPPGQTLYVLSKAIAIFVYILMWCQIMLGITKKVNIKYHMIFGIIVFVLILSHVFLFISAVSFRQGELSLGMLLPSFSVGYYKSGLSLGVLSLFLIFVAIVSGVMKKKFYMSWKIGHSLVYLTFAVVTVHGLMIGSDFSSKFFTYIVYGAVLSLFAVFFYKKLTIFYEA